MLNNVAQGFLSRICLQVWWTQKHGRLVNYNVNEYNSLVTHSTYGREVLV